MIVSNNSINVIDFEEWMNTGKLKRLAIAGIDSNKSIYYENIKIYTT